MSPVLIFVILSEANTIRHESRGGATSFAAPRTTGERNRVLRVPFNTGKLTRFHAD